jgi:BNR/Asp-box repeat protein
MTELLVGTRKGLFLLEGDPGAEKPFDVTARAFPGNEVEFAIRHPGSGRYFASVTSGHYGPRVMHTMDPRGEWEQTAGLAFPEDADWSVERIWSIRPGEGDGLMYAGVAPAALFASTDGGMTWELNRALWDQPTRHSWQPGAGGLCLHSIATWPGDPTRLALGISAVGVWLSEDGGRSWRHGNAGLVPQYVPDDARETTIDLCVHNMHRAPLRPERLFIQFHGGVYRSDDAGETWNSIAAGLPSDFGFPMVIDPADPDSAFVIPLAADDDRVTVDGRVRVYETRDAGASWTSRSDGLPQADAYLTILRQAFDHEGEGAGMGLYFGATSGDVFGSADAGSSWFTVRERLAPVNSVRVA